VGINSTSHHVTLCQAVNHGQPYVEVTVIHAMLLWFWT